jgi:hypothetical protein
MAQNSLRNLREQLRDIVPAMGLTPDPALPCNWVKGTFLVGILDAKLRRLTGEGFPFLAQGKVLTPQDTHPIFLLERISNLGYRFCPCTTKTYNAQSCSFIPAGTQLLPPGRGGVMGKDSYLLAQYEFNLTENTHVAGSGNFFGIVPERAIQGEAHNRGGGK